MDKGEPVSRRNFLNLSFLHKETVPETLQPTISTPKADYYGLYENHIKGIAPERIYQISPNIYFLEGISTPSNIINTDASTQLHGCVETIAGDKIDFFPGKMLGIMSDKNTSVCFEGVSYPMNPGQNTAIEIAEIIAGVAITNVGLAKTTSEKLSHQLTRRKFIKNTLLTISGAAIASGSIANQVANVLLNTNQIDNPVSRHLIGILTDLHPESIQVFFRNAIMAKKLDSTSTSTETGQKPKIAYKVGAAHTGIEHFLALGPELTTKIICAYPKEFLKQTITINGGLDAFCSTVIIPVKPNLDNPNVNVKKVIVDRELKSALAYKLGIQI